VSISTSTQSEPRKRPATWRKVLPAVALAALMSLNMLIETEGRNYTPAEYSAWLTAAGFCCIETVWFGALAANGAVIGRKP
jgi:hypothetical protein